MLASAIPAKFPIPFANGAGGGFINTIPQASQIGVTPGAASLTDGLPPLNFQPVASGGIPPRGSDFNGLFNQITLWNQWHAAGGPVVFDSAFSTSIGGYPKGAILESATVNGNQWVSSVDNNTTDPDSASAANWSQVGLPTGTPVPSLTSTVPAGYVPANALTIGNAASNATSRANADTWPLFNFLWQAFSNSDCPIFTSAGGASTRGATPTVDYAANKALATPNMKGLGLIGADTMGGAVSTFLSGVPVTSGSTVAPGSIVGENLHAIIAAELAVHAHANSLTDPGHVHPTNVTGFSQLFGVGTGATLALGSPFGGNTSSAVTGITITNANAGSGSPHNTVQRNRVVYWNLKL
jgi:hypothetical protein